MIPDSEKSARKTLKRKKTDDEWLCDLKKDPTYSHVDIDNELGKMKQWLSLPKNAKRKLTRPFILNWINKIDKPLEGVSNVASTAGNGSRPKTYREIDADNEVRNRRNYLIASGLIPPDGSLVDAGLPGLPDPRKENA